jgi:hypothetical protein
MKHVGAHQLWDGIYVALSNTILLLCTHTAEGLFHLVTIAVVFEFS